MNYRQKWNTQRRNVKVGDIVLLKDDEVPRMEWPLAVVIETQESNDGLIRRVKIKVGTKTSDGKKGYLYKPSILERPIQRLVVLVEAKD